MANPQQYGNFVPTTNVWDLGDIYSLPGESDQLKELLVRLYQNLNLMSTSLNLRDAGYYVTSEFVNGQLWFPNPNNTGQSSQAGLRQDYRKTFFKILPGGLGALGESIPHGITITPTTSFTRIYGVANDQTTPFFRPLPYVSPDGNHIAINVNKTDITIIPLTVAYPNINLIYVVLEYLQS